MFLESLYGSSSKEDVRFWNEIVGGQRTSAGVQVSESNATNFSAYYAAVRKISGDLATIPAHVYRRVSDDRRERVADHVLERVLNLTPNGDGVTDAISYREAMTACCLTWGNAYSEIVRSGARVDGLMFLHPSRVKVVMLDDGGYAYEVRNANGQPSYLSPDRVFHLKGLGGDGLTGWSVARLAKETIGLGLAAEQYGAGWFGNGARPGGVLKHPHRLSKTAADRIRESWKNLQGGPEHAHEVAVLEEGMDWQSISTPPEDSQFLDTRIFQVREIARWFLIPSRFLGDPEGESYASAEMLWLDYLTTCLRYWLEKWELAVQRSLLLESERRAGLYVEHQTEALLKADLKARYEAYRVAREGGWMSANDVLRRENMNPIGEKGDIYLVPKNFGSAEHLLEHGDWETPEEGADPQARAAGAEAEMAADTPRVEIHNHLAPAPVENHVHVPAQVAPTVNVQTPPQPVPVVNVAAPAAPELRAEIHLPEQPAPVVNNIIELPRPEPPTQPSEAVVAAHRALLADALGRMLRKEIANVRQAAKKPGEFLEWLEGYYPHHEKLLAEAVTPVLAAWLSVYNSQGECASRVGQDLAAENTIRSRNMLLDVAGNATPAQFADAVEACVAGWEARAQEAAETVIV